jgi:hypothetical protein
MFKIKSGTTNPSAAGSGLTKYQAVSYRVTLEKTGID